MEYVDYTLRIPLTVLKYFGLYTEAKSKRIIIFTSLYCTIFVFSDIMSLMQFSYMTSANVDEIVNNGEAFAVYAHVGAKLAAAAYNHGKLIKILQDTRKFWTLDVCTNDRLKIKLQNLSLNVVRFQRLFFSCTILALLAVILDSFIRSSLPFGTWSKSSPEFLYTPTFYSYLFGILIGGTTVSAIDNIFLAFTINIAIQFQILCYCLRQLSVSEDYAMKIKACIKHHNFLIEFATSVQDYFSVILLAEYLTICPMICCEMCLLSESNTAQLTVKHSIYLCTLTVQLSFYCFTADILTTEAEAVAEAIYDSDWYSEYFPAERRSIIRIIQISQRKIAFTAGGLTSIDRPTLETVLRVSFSACTLLRTVK